MNTKSSVSETVKDDGASETGKIDPDKTTAKAQGEAAGITEAATRDAFDLGGAAPADSIEDLQLRVNRLEHTLFTLLNNHFGGKIPALAAPPALD